jgi:hypothetical protein
MSEIAATISAKKTHNRAFPETLVVGGQPANCTGKTILIILESADVIETLTVGSGIVWTNQAAGAYTWTVTPAHIAALGNPATINTFLTVYNADDSVFVEDNMTLNVTY